VLADTHCHLNLKDFEPDLPQVLTRARQAGIGAMVVPGIDLESSRRGLKLAEAWPSVFAAIGIHPHHAAEWGKESREALEEMAQSGRVVAIGEVGLDYYRDRCPRGQQRTALVGQLELAGRLGLPAIIHNREATTDLLAILEDWSQGLEPGLADRAGVLHAYSADLSTAADAVEAGFYLGIGGPLTYPNADERRAITAQLPPSRVLIETDAPYLPPHPHRGERNEPAMARLVAEALARLVGMSYEDVAAASTRNATALFGWTDGNDDNDLL
jgi:TatD DNase family protein